MDNLLENISMKEARALIELVTALAKSLAFTRREYLTIVSVCKMCIDRLEKEEGGLNE